MESIKILEEIQDIIEAYMYDDPSNVLVCIESYIERKKLELEKDK
jgi:hypothetical protein